MAREYARIRLSIWEDDHYLDLSPAAQHLYYVLTTDPGMSYCGRVDWRPARLTPRARGWTTEQITAAAAELERERFVLFDPDTEEALVRSLIRSDELLRNPKMGISVVKAYGAMASRTLRAAVVTEVKRARDEHPEYSSWTSPMSADHLSRLAALADLDSVGYTNRITNHITNDNGDDDPVGNGDEDGSGSAIPTQVRITNADRSVSYPHTAYRRQQTEKGYVTGERHQGDDADHDGPPPPRHCDKHPDRGLKECPDCWAQIDERREWTSERVAVDVAPPAKCDKHLDDPNPPNCGACKVKREEREAWESGHARRVAEAQALEKRRAARTKAQAIENCNLCDASGYVTGEDGASLCAHDPEDVDRRKRGMAGVRERMGWKAAAS